MLTAICHSLKVRFFSIARYFFLVLAIFTSFPHLCLAEKVLIKRVIDGDTVVTADNTRVRLIGINAPEIENIQYAHRGEPYGEEAKKSLRDLVEGQVVDLKNGPEANDKYGRRLAYLYSETGLLINQHLVAIGAAEAYRRFPHPLSETFIETERHAKEKKLGIWAIEKITPVWWKRLFGIKQ